MDFRKKYPLTMSEVINDFVVFRENIPFMSELPFPSPAGIRDFAEYAGYSYSAVRTALSRARAEGRIGSFTDSRGKIRYRLTELHKSISKAVSQQFSRPEGFILAVFSFKKDNEKERKSVRDTLKLHGFKKLAQNTYINGRIDTEGMLKSMREYGVEKNLYLFHCPDISDPSLKEKILSVFNIEGRKIILSEFYESLVQFLTEKDTSDDETARRLFYVGPVHYRICFVEEPPFPEKYLPNDYPLKKIIDFFTETAEKNGNKFIQYYSQVNK